MKSKTYRKPKVNKNKTKKLIKNGKRSRENNKSNIKRGGNSNNKYRTPAENVIKRKVLPHVRLPTRNSLILTEQFLIHGGYTPKNNGELRVAVDLWCDNKEEFLRTHRNCHIKDWNVSLITDMSYLFQQKTNFNDDISNWDVSRVNNMRYMFFRCFSFNQPLDKWGDKLSRVKDMSYMFNLATAFNQDLNGWDVSNVDDVSYMFDSATAFNHNNIATWYDKLPASTNSSLIFEHDDFDYLDNY